MKKFLGALVAGALVFASAAPAYAHDHRGYGGYDRRYYDRRHDDHGDAVASGLVGLAIGALIGSALSQPRYEAPPPPPPYGYQGQGYQGQAYQGQGYYGPQPYQGGYNDGGYAEPPRLCTVHERQYDPYVGRTLTIERQVPCD